MLISNQRLKILIVDDAEENIMLLSAMLEDDYEIMTAADGVQALACLEEHIDELSLMLLDIQMPNMNGIEVLHQMKERHLIEKIPVIVISSETKAQIISEAYAYGANDYIARPFHNDIVNHRVKNVITSYAKEQTMRNILMQEIDKKERENRMMIYILAHIVEFHNGESGLHIQHINTITDFLLSRLIKKVDVGIDKKDIPIIRLASSLHDIGKITIPSEIINKPGRFTDEEFKIMQGHAAAGAKILEDLPFFQNELLLKYSADICRWHHERWDGRGYPDKLVGDQIPMWAQIVALADVYDALTSVRCYKAAFTHEEAMRMILNNECGVFNPLLMELLQENAEDLRAELENAEDILLVNAEGENDYFKELLQTNGLM